MVIGKDKVAKIVDEIKKLEKKYKPDEVRRACNRYYMKMSEERRLEKDIRSKEKELERLRATKHKK